MLKGSGEAGDAAFVARSTGKADPTRLPRTGPPGFDWNQMPFPPESDAIPAGIRCHSRRELAQNRFLKSFLWQT